jgi:hypothetical protein
MVGRRGLEDSGICSEMKAAVIESRWKDCERR